MKDIIIRHLDGDGLEVTCEDSGFLKQLALELKSFCNVHKPTFYKQDDELLINFGTLACGNESLNAFSIVNVLLECEQQYKKKKKPYLITEHDIGSNSLCFHSNKPEALEGLYQLLKPLVLTTCRNPGLYIDNGDSFELSLSYMFTEALDMHLNYKCFCGQGNLVIEDD